MALIEYRAENGLAILEFNNPPANAYTLESLKELDAAIVKARFDSTVHVIVLRGAGEKFFSAGADINMLSKESNEFRNQFALFGHETLSRLENTPKLVIAAINGHCVGGGLEVAMAADLRVARRGAGKMGLPEVSLGVLPGTGGTQRLARLVGKSKAIELMAAGELFDFEKGEALGLVNRMVDASDSVDFIKQVMDYARQFTTPHKATRAVGRIKRAVQTGAEMPFESALALERELQQQLFQSEDAKAGLDAYVQKRKADFKGK